MSQLPNCISSPPWWQIIQWIVDPLGFQDRCARQYGEIFSLNLKGMGPMVMISNPQMIKEIFRQSSQFDSGRGNALANVLSGVHSLPLLDGEQHRRERKLLMPPFHGERVQSYGQLICKSAAQVADSWELNQPFELRTMMQQISLEVILNVVFGLHKGERYETLKKLIPEWLNIFNSPLHSSFFYFKFLRQNWGLWRKSKQQQLSVHDLFQAEIDQRRTQENQHQNENHSRNDVLSMMMAARDDHGKPMTDKELREELITLLFAGHETTATILSWALYQIGQRPDVLAKLLEELDTSNIDTLPNTIAQLPYLKAVCDETLRLYPVLPCLLLRITKVLVEIGDYQFAPETTLMISSYLVHSREDLYSNARHFNPDRFLNHQYSQSEYFPFGGGNRGCLGYALALLEIKLVLATILSKYQLELMDNKPVKLQRRGFILSPNRQIRMRVVGKR